MACFAAILRWQKPHLFPIKSAFAALIADKPPSNIPMLLAGRGTLAKEQACKCKFELRNLKPYHRLMTKIVALSNSNKPKGCYKLTNWSKILNNPCCEWLAARIAFCVRKSKKIRPYV